MSVRYHDWYGRYKLADIGGYSALVGPNAGPMETADWWVRVIGKRPDIRNVYEVDEEFYNRFRGEYEAKGLFYDGGEGGGNEL